MTKRAYTALLAASVAAAGCGGGGDSASSYPQYEPPTYEAIAQSYDPQADVYRALAQQQVDAEYQARVRELQQEQREWQRQKNVDWAKGFTNPYD
jgi:hypothetical protein